MKSRCSWWTACVAAVLLLATGSWAQSRFPYAPFSGLINDYTPVSGVSGPWEMHGEWSLGLYGESGAASFSATLNMTHSDYWVVLNPGSADDNSSMTGRHPHTHHITVTHATVTPLTTGGFELSGPVYVTNDGNPAPFMSKCTPAYHALQSNCRHHWGKHC